MYYKDYLGLDKVLDAQHLESVKLGRPAHDEMLFIIVHQAYELWFKQILHEVDSVVEIIDEPFNDNTPELSIAVHRLERVVEILRLLVDQVNIIETMTPLDFLDFRDMLRPASGFQSVQFKVLEAKLGLNIADRHGHEYFMSHLSEEDKKVIMAIDPNMSVIVLVNRWLERMPYFDEPDLWSGYLKGQNNIPAFWSHYREQYMISLAEGERQNMDRFDLLFMNDEEPENHKLTSRARRSALFIMLFRGYPIMHMPFQLINKMLEIDELMSNWRYRHMNMVHRMIGTRVGTGGSTGKSYLRDAVAKHYVFSEVAELTSYLIERSKLPELSPELEAKLGFRL